VIKQLQVVIVDDHPPIREGLTVLLRNRGFLVTGTAGSLEEAARAIRAARPDVALVDIVLGKERGTELVSRFQGEVVSPAFLLYTGLPSRQNIAEAAACGAAGVATKLGSLDDLAAALLAAASGDSYRDQTATEVLRDSDGPGFLTAREREVIGLLAAGLSTDEIATQLFLSLYTVRTHIQNAVHRLGARGRVHAVVLAAQYGEIELPSIDRSRMR
jgi:DNA-binding NarL/FixJ family response regulator